MPLVKIAIVFALIIVLLRLKLPLGWVLVAATAVLAGLFGEPWRTVREGFLTADFVGSTVSLTVTILLLNTLGQLFAASGDMRRLIVSLEHVLGDARAALALVPTFIGFLPMPGGAMLSAPAVGEVGDRIDLGATDRTVVNHWFRHVWEYISPLYPGVILLLSFQWLHADYGQIVAIMWPMTVLALGVGVIVYLLPLGRKAVERHAGRHHGHNLLDISRALWPVAAVTASAVTFGDEWIMPALVPVIVLVALQGRALRSRRDVLPAALLILAFAGPSALAAATGDTLWNVPLIASGAALVIVVRRMEGRPLADACRRGFTWTMTTTLVGVCLFKGAVGPSGAAKEVGDALAALGLNPFVMLFALPFIVGLLAGATMVYVGTTLPLLGAAGLITAGPTLLLAYAAGFMGVMLSPVHPCLVLTIDYFKAPVGAVYRKLSLAVVIISLAAVALALAGWPWGMV